MRNVPVIAMGPETYAMMKIALRGKREGWNWRRVKREMAKGTRSTYRGGWDAQ